MQKKRSPLLLFSFIFLPFLLLQSCASDTRNDAEKRITGKWKQVSGSGELNNLNIVLKYEFLDKKAFNMEGKVAGQTLRSMSCSYKIPNDSLLLFYGTNTAEPGYSAKVIFNDNNKMSLFDANGEYNFEKQN